MSFGAGTHVKIIEEFPAAGDFEVEIEAGPGAQVEWISLNTVPLGEVRIVHKARLSEGAHIHWRIITLAGANTDHAVESRAEGENVETSLDWAFYAHDKERHVLRAHNLFLGREGGGQITMNGVAENSAHVACNGMIEIGEKGGGTNTYLTQEVLMLDPTARVDAVPGLEIRTNDVKASHSATVRRVSPEDLFYFASRGIDEGEARRMFVTGFLGKMLESIGAEALKERIAQAIEAKYSRS